MDMYLNSNRTGSTQNTEVHAAINNKRSTLSVIQSPVWISDGNK